MADYPIDADLPEWEAIRKGRVRGYGHLRADADELMSPGSAARTELATMARSHDNDPDKLYDDYKKKRVEHYTGKGREDFLGYARGGKVLNTKSWSKRRG